MFHLLSRTRTAYALPHGERVYAVGDIHGRLDLLDALLAKIEIDVLARHSAFITLLFLGDLIDRGPDSASVVRRAMVKPVWADNVIVLKGNHEDAMLEGLAGDLTMAEVWLRVGGDMALISWGFSPTVLRDSSIDEIINAAKAIIPRVERAWLSDRPTSYQLGQFLFVHAGIRPGIPLKLQNKKDFLWIRDDFLKSRADHGVMVVHGHTISEQVEFRSNRIGVDTGAYLTGQLTALCLEGLDRWLIKTI